MVDLVQTRLDIWIEKADKCDPVAAEILLCYAARQLPGGDLHPRAARWLARALIAVVNSPERARNELGLSWAKNTGKDKAAALCARNHAIQRWAKGFWKKNPGVSLSSAARELMDNLRPGGRISVDRYFIAKLHKTEFDPESETIICILAHDEILGATVRGGVPMEKLEDSYKSITGLTTFRDILRPAQTK